MERIRSSVRASRRERTLVPLLLFVAVAAVLAPHLIATPGVFDGADVVFTIALIWLLVRNVRAAMRDGQPSRG